MIDLHMHTNHSDGTDSVEELLKNAESKKLEIISITDHDQVGAYCELEENPELRKLFSGKIIVGSELKTYFEGISIEILAYGVDYKIFEIHKVDMTKLQEEILEKLKNIARSIGLKFDEENTYIDRKDPTKQFAGFILGTELLKYEENKEIISRIGEFTSGGTFFRAHQSNKDSIFYVDETNYSIDINETIRRIHEAGGLAFLAHCYEYPFKNVNETVEKIFNTTDIDGIEAIYPTFSEAKREEVFKLAQKYNKYVSGGTDYHANNKPYIDLGTGINNNMCIEKSFIKDWADKVKMI